MPANNPDTELVINFSGGKDSCAMLAWLCETFPAAKKHVVFANTGWEHENAEAWCRSIVERYGLELHTIQNETKGFISMVRQRGKFPSSGQRQCTSDLKRDPIEKWIRRNVKADKIINCMGIRSEESNNRKKMPTISRNGRMSNNTRTVANWNPIKDWTETQVLEFLAARDIPLHPVYKYLRRFSCRVCIFMSDHDLRQVNKFDPEAIRIIADLEQEINFSMKPGKFLKDIVDQAA